MENNGYQTTSQLCRKLRISEQFFLSEMLQLGQNLEFYLQGKTLYGQEEVARWQNERDAMIAEEQQRLETVVAESKGESSPTTTQCKDDV